MSNSKNNHKQKVLELCAGMGGTRSAFVKNGFNIVQSIEYEDYIADFHKSYWGDCDCVDLTEVEPNYFADANILSAGFPCQPFSTSGYRTGFSHEKGHVFSSILNIIDNKSFELVFLENVTGLFSNNSGITFSKILYELSMRYKHVEWGTINLLNIDIPHNRPRVVITAHSNNNLLLHKNELTFGIIGNTSLFSTNTLYSINFDSIYKDKIEHSKNGFINEGKYVQLQDYDIKSPLFKNINLGEYIFDKNINVKIKSGRFWGRTGKTTFYTSENNYSHSIGTSMGGAPTFSIDPNNLNNNIKKEIERVSNWQSEHSEQYVFRLKPEVALKFFGKMSMEFSESIANYSLPIAKKYKMIGNMFSSDQASFFINKIFHN